MRKFYIVLLLTFLFSDEISSQDNIHYSQFYNSPLLLNPALTGQFPNDLSRFTGIYRQQWAGAVGADPLYKTMSGSADLSLFKRRLGIGLQVLNDQAGGVFNTINIYPSASYSFIMGDDALTFGLQPMISNSSINTDSTFTIVDENFQSSTFFDVNFGANFHKDLVFAKFDIGVSAQQLLESQYSFNANSVPKGNTLRYFRAYIFSDWDITERFKILPGFYGSFESQATNFLVGSNVSFRALGSSEEGSRFIMGLWFRTNYNNLESIIPKMGIQSGKLKVLASYDYNSGLSLSNDQYFDGLLNTFEISVIFTAKPKKVPPLLEDRFILNPRY